MAAATSNGRSRRWSLASMTSVAFVIGTYILYPLSVQAHSAISIRNGDSRLEMKDTRQLQSNRPPQDYVVWIDSFPPLGSETAPPSTKPPPSTPILFQQSQELSEKPSDAKNPTALANNKLELTTPQSSPPTYVPTLSPSVSPGPSNMPSEEPSVDSVESRNESPFAEPRVGLSNDLPTAVDASFTFTPSDQPTTVQTELSTMFSSEMPSSELSTTFSSAIPSDLPSDQPTTTTPTSRPSNVPSHVPTIPPSESPSKSKSPSHSPSQHPTRSILPSVLPSTSPSTLPSDSPSEPPSSMPSDSPSTSPSTSFPSSNPSVLPSYEPSDARSPSPSGNPSKMPSQLPSTIPSQAPTEFSFESSTFYVIADTPYTEEERLAMPRLISSISDDALFAIHLGDIIGMAEPCNNETFSRFASYLETSPIPFFIVPGDNEVADCGTSTSEREAAMELWRQHFVRFDIKHWNHTLNVQTMPGRPESFTFEHGGTLFIGLNIVGLPRYNKDEWRERLSTQADWTIDLIEQRRDGDNGIGAIVIMAHAQLRETQHRHFLDPLLDYIDDDLDNEIPILYIQGDVHSWAYDKKYKGMSSLVRVRKNSGTDDPATKIITHPTRSGVEQRREIDGADMFDVIQFPEQHEFE